MGQLKSFLVRPLRKKRVDCSHGLSSVFFFDTPEVTNKYLPKVLKAISVPWLSLNGCAASPWKTVQYLVREIVFPYNEMFLLWDDVVNNSILPHNSICHCPLKGSELTKQIRKLKNFQGLFYRPRDDSSQNIYLF